MRIDGYWQYEVDNLEKAYPTLGANLEVDGIEYPLSFLIDTGADRTFIGSNFKRYLIPYRQESSSSFVGASGAIESMTATAKINFTDSTGRIISFQIVCAVFENQEKANDHLLGRDILDYFALICDRSAEIVTLLRPPHTYQIIGS